MLKVNILMSVKLVQSNLVYGSHVLNSNKNYQLKLS